ncbi:hypothetical protein ASE01_17090 [Nocardioides sp. Root190]|nr:hypothetical protein ASE01_17090 [Nocardioides sp. Root190]
MVAALGVVEQAADWSVAAISDLIAERRMLLVLDNCEHVLDACAVLADTLLKTCPNIKILATSRQPLRIPGEHCVEVEPLAPPGPDAEASLETLARNEAVALFVERASAVHPDFRLDQGNAQTVASICRRVDGIALAIELAAGRLRALSVEQLHARLDSRYDVLAGGSRTALPRQKTMRALIDWSFSLCTPAEQRVWARLSVFVDGFSLLAAEQVCADTDDPTETVFEHLEGLVDKSVVTADRTTGDTRYRLAETLREYGADRLDEFNERVTTRLRARDWCGHLVDRMLTDWFSPKQPELLQTLRLEHGNIRVALDFCLTTPGEATHGLIIASRLRHYWMASARSTEGRHWLDRLLAHDPQPSPERLMALCTCAHLTNGQTGKLGAVDRMLNEAASLAQDLEDPRGSAYVAQMRGLAMLFRRDFDQAVKELRWASDAHKHLNDQASAAYDLAVLASAKSANDESDVQEVLHECLSLCAAAGEAWIRSFALFTSGVERCKAGDFSGSVDAQRESLMLRKGLDVRNLMALNIDALAWVAVERNDAERAARLFGATEAIMCDAGGTLVTQGLSAPMHETYQSRAQAALGHQGFQSAFEAGLQMRIEDAIDYALDERALPAERTDKLAGPAGTSVLTAREFQVSHLIARGHTNKQIAAALVISQRTAEAHVQNILSKLNFTARTQIASWITENDSDTGSTRPRPR